MVETNGFRVLEISNCLLTNRQHSGKIISLYGINPSVKFYLHDGQKHFGFVAEGRLNLLHNESRNRSLYEGDFFSVSGRVHIQSRGRGFVISVQDYNGFTIFGGPLEREGKLRYIDGCTDTLLVPPVRKGDPCLNYLHFPPNVRQTLHTHPSVRIGLVYKGGGDCVFPNQEKVVLIPGAAFVIKPDAIHSFHTSNSPLEIIAFHPDSDVGMTDDNHPMINRTFIDGVSASKK